MEALEKLSMEMINDSARYEQAELREKKYYTEQAEKEGISLEKYKENLRNQKIRTMAQEYVFGEKDDIILFTDCWKSFGFTPEMVERMRQRIQMGYAHRHGYFEMFYVLKGHCYNYINNQEEVFHEGSFCLMNSQVIHERILPDADSVIITICIRKNVFDTYLLNMLREIPIFWQFFTTSIKNDEQPAAYMHLQNTPNPNLEAIIYQMMRAYLLDDATSQTILKCSLVPLLVEMARSSDIAGFQTTPGYIRTQQQITIDNILQIIRANCESITLAELAQMSNFTPNYLSALIKKQTGKTFQELVSYYWTEKAKTLLQCTPFNISEIAELMQASSRGNFERRFKALTGMSPAQYRKQ